MFKIAHLPLLEGCPSYLLLCNNQAYSHNLFYSLTVLWVAGVGWGLLAWDRSQLSMVTLRTMALALFEHAPLGSSVQSIFNAI